MNTLFELAARGGLLVCHCICVARKDINALQSFPNLMALRKKPIPLYVDSSAVRPRGESG